jgi:ABC-2 type transport system permease protein
MNPIVLSREIRSNVKYTLIWTSAMTLTLILNTLSVVLPARSAGNAYDVPTALAGAIYNLLYAGPIFAMILGSLAISREEDEKTIEFLLAHPITRSEIAVSKLLAYTVAVVFLNAVLMATGLILIAALGGTSGRGVASFLSVCLSDFMMIYGFGAAGMFLSMFIVKGGAVVGYSIGIPLLLGLLVYLQTTGNEILQALSYLSPFRYLNVAGIMATGRVDAPFVCVTAAISMGLLAASVALYRKKEFAV